MPQLGFSNYTNRSTPQNPPVVNTPLPQLPNLNPLAESNVSNVSAHFSGSQYSQLPPKPPKPPVQQTSPMAESQVVPIDHEANKTIPNIQLPLQQMQILNPSLNPNAASQVVESTQPINLSANQPNQQPQKPALPPGVKPHPALNYLYSSVADKVSEEGRIHL